MFSGTAMKILSTLIAGAFAANFGLTGVSNDASEEAQQQVSAAMEQIMPSQIDNIVPLSMTTTVRSDIQSDVNAGVRQLDRSARQVPVYALKVAQQVEEHGIAALAYSDPVLQEEGRSLGKEIGQGIRHFAVALGKDLVASAHDSGIKAN